ncbi:MAG: NAD(P)-dependent oxidoreductase [Planctomycetes bacterium]|nr:NAD(P)-dependent oxidoreductase [Planctomycetota bacterium]
MLESNQPLPTFGILQAGELGTALGRALLDRGHAVVTTVADRSQRTADRAREAGLEIVDSLEDVLHRAEVIVSVVPSVAALHMAQRVVQRLNEDCRAEIYIDANSISPISCRAVSQVVSRRGLQFADLAIHGLASELTSNATGYLSGDAAEQVNAWLTPIMRTRLLGPTAGRASAMNMLLDGMSQGIAALFIELSALGREMGLQAESFDEYRHYYPAVAEIVERLLPTYPHQAPNRTEEMVELEQTLRINGIQPAMIAGTRRTLAALSRLEVPATGAQGAGNLPLSTFIDAVVGHQALSV